MADTQQHQKGTNQKSNSPTAGKNAAFIGNTSKQGKRNKRRRNRGKRNPVQSLKKYTAPVKEYVSKCCGSTAKKPSTGKPTGNSEKQKGATDHTQVVGLGGWRCGSCGKPCKVSPQAPKPKEEAVEAHV